MLRVQRPLHHGSLASRAPVVPLSRYRGGGKSRRPHNAIRVGVTCRASRELRESLFPIHHSPLAFVFPQIKRGGGTPANAGHQPPHLTDAARALVERARLTAFHHGSRLRELFHPKGSAQARLPGTQSARALPAFACPSPGSTSRPGHRAGGPIPKPPGSGLQIRPRAPHPLHLTACLRWASLGERDFRYVTKVATNVKRESL